jgi:arylsulfatase A-like enzyme
MKRAATLALSLSLLGCLSLSAGSCSKPTAGGAPNILLIVIDTLRADRLGAYGNERGLTPFLDELARRGTVFLNAYAPSSWTCPSVASLFTSRYASQHRVVNFAAKLSDGEVTLAEQLSAAGYVGGGFTANIRLLHEQGYDQGFGYWRVFLPPSGQKERGDRVRREVSVWVDNSMKVAWQRPLLAYIQFMEPHAPYQPPEPHRTKFQRHDDPGVDLAVAEQKLLRVGQGVRGLSAAELELLESLYDGEVAAIDEQIRFLFADLETRGFLDNAIVVITADHGEEFGEHGQLQHGITLYNAAVKVPLIIAAPGVARGRVVSDNVSLVDVAPTIMELANLPPVPTFEGRSLVPLMQTGIWAQVVRSTSGQASSPILTELETIGGWDLRIHTQALIRPPHKLTLRTDGKSELYDLERDPDEKRPLNGAAGAPANDLRGALTQTREAIGTRAGTAESKPLDEATKEKLRALGYHF